MRPHPARLFGCLLLGALAHCSGSGGGSGNLGGATPASLVSTCDQICSNVVAKCAGSASLDAQCLAACNDVGLVQLGCIDPFASYLACMAGATSVQCGLNGQDVLITIPQCESDRQAVVMCNAPPGAVAACLQLPDNTPCGPSAPKAMVAMFCVGAPTGCHSPAPNPIGIGTYCCP
jgi:hypothetical protein